MKNIIVSTIRQLDLQSRPDGAFFVRLLFIVGTIFGCTVGFYFCDEVLGEGVYDYICRTFLFEDLFSAAFYVCRFFLLLILFGTSYAGIFLIPALSTVKAYVLSSTVASAYALYGLGSLKYLFFSFAIPAAVCLPCFFCLADILLAASRRLYFFRFHEMMTTPVDGIFLKVLAVSAVLLLVSMYRCSVVPLIFSYIA